MLALFFFFFGFVFDLPFLSVYLSVYFTSWFCPSCLQQRQQQQQNNNKTTTKKRDGFSFQKQNNLPCVRAPKGQPFEKRASLLAGQTDCVWAPCLLSRILGIAFTLLRVTTTGIFSLYAHVANATLCFGPSLPLAPPHLHPLPLLCAHTFRVLLNG